MSGGLFGLLDDVAVLTRLAAATGRATAKAAGVVIDDTAVANALTRLKSLIRPKALGAVD